MHLLDTKDILDRIDSDDIIKLLNSLGSELYKENDNELIFYTICHPHSDDIISPKLYFYKDSKVFRCYSNCGNMSLFDLVMKVNNCTFIESIKYIKDTLNLGVNKKPKRGFGSYKPNVTKVIKDIEIEKLPIINKPFIYTIFSNCHIPAWEDEGISFDTLNKYNIRFDKEKNRVIIPHFDIDDRIIGVRTRLLDPIAAEKYGKYIPLFYGDYGYAHPLGKNLYGLNHNKQNIKLTKKVQVWEGEKSTLITDTMFGKNSISVSLCGSSFSKMQMKMLLNLGVEEVIMCLDKQYNNKQEEVEWYDKIRKMVKPLISEGIKVTTIWDNLENGLLEYKMSPVDAGAKIFKELVKNRIEIKGMID